MEERRLGIQADDGMKIFIVGVAAAMLLQRIDSVQTERRLQSRSGREDEPPYGQLDWHGKLHSPAERNEGRSRVLSRMRGGRDVDIDPQGLIPVAPHREGKRVARLIGISIHARDQRIGP